MNEKREYVQFDQYQRYMTVSHVIEYWRRKEENVSYRILELGSNEHKDLEAFLPNDEILYTDLVLTEKMKSDPAFMQADGSDLPFEDGSFDFVVSLDVLEHVPEERRKLFFSEASRVAGKAAILSFPYQAPYIEDAENRVNSFYKAVTGDDFIWLKEHRENGLPDLNRVEAALGNLCLNSVRFFHGDIHIWEKMWYSILRGGVETETQEYCRLLNRYYNQNLYKQDISEHCYRAFYVISRVDLAGLERYVSTLWESKKEETYDLLPVLLQAQERVHDLHKAYQAQNGTKKDQSAIYAANLYFDYGEGYKQENSVSATYDASGFVDFTVSVPDRAAAVRLDMVEGYFCAIKNLEIITNHGALPYRNVNGLSIERLEVFCTTDPQIEICLSSGVSWLRVRADVFVISDTRLFSEMQSVVHTEKQKCDSLRGALAQTETERESLRGALAQAETERDSLRGALAQTETERDSLRGELAQTETERDSLRGELAQTETERDSLRGELAQTETERDSLRGALAETETERDNLRGELAETKTERDSLRGELAETKTERDSLRGELAETKTERDSLRGELAETETERDRLREQLQQIAAQVDVLNARLINVTNSFEIISNATCWKITKPIRVVLDAAKQTESGAFIQKAAQYTRVFGFSAAAHKALDCIPKKQRGTKAPSKGKVTALAPILSMREMVDAIKKANGAIYGKEYLLKENGKERVLIVSHELDLTGAPVAAFNLAEALLSMGKEPIMLSPHDGALRQQINKQGIPAVVLDSVYQNDLVLRSAGLFSMIVVSTIVGAPLISMLNGEQIPVLWWIHEARVSYHEGAVAALPRTLEKNIRVYCGGPYAQQILREYCPSYLSDQLLYYVPDYTESLDMSKSLPIKIESGKKVFAAVGAFEERKGQDIFIDSIRLLPAEARARCVFAFVGREYYAPSMRKLRELMKQFPENVIYIPQLNRAELTALYNRMDCLVCSSRDDPMPIVVTDAMALSKIVICSENTGSAAFIEKMEAGIIYRNNDPRELMQCLLCVIEGKDDFTSMRENARRVYKDNFSYEVFRDNISSVYSQLTSTSPIMPDGLISVVIPTYNAGKEFRTLLELLNYQEGIRELEVIVVDSGSTDGTPEMAEQYGAMVIRIPQSEFSHSHARNLGAEHASGRYVLFMTQDALPGSSKWLLSMAQPLLNRSAVAVSCREEPRKDCDLLGRLNIWVHSSYMGILQNDRILKMPEVRNVDEVRKNAQLNDVACMVRCDIFREFGYRGDYAEDLDLGLRLMESGYHLSLLSGCPVIHSHTRPGYYHLKRCLVDTGTLKKLLPETPMENIDEAECLNRIVTVYAATKMYVEALHERLMIPECNEAFFLWSDRFFTSLIKELEKSSYADIVDKLIILTPYEDEKMHALIMDMYVHSADHFRPSCALILTQQYRLATVLPSYFADTGEATTAEVKKLIAEMAMKQVGLLAGIMLASYGFYHEEDRSYLNDLMTGLRKGV